MQQSVADTRRAQAGVPIIRDWTVKRSGPGLTVNGASVAGERRTVTGISTITPSGTVAVVWARDKAGKVVASLMT